MDLSYSPVLLPPRPEDVAGLAAAEGISIEAAAKALVDAREMSIARMREDPVVYGYIPPVWKLCMALLNSSWVDQEYAARMREVLGFKRPVKTLLALGGNRAGKTRFEGYLGMKTLITRSDARMWMFHMTHQESVDYHQTEMWEMIPKPWRKKVKSEVQYISYSEQMGFSNDKFILFNGSSGSFRNYSQNMRDAIEGGEPDIVCADELIPGDWVETLEFRVATRNGVIFLGFTPVEGYSGTVKMFCDGATVAKRSTAFLLPTDGGPPDEARALGLSDEEYSEVQAALDEERKPECLPCRPEDCDAWLTGGTGQPETPEGRRFELMPRVLRCADPSRAVVFFWSNDNPFGNPANVIRKTRQVRMEDKRIRFYGWADKLTGARLHTFDEDVHVVPAGSIPGHGTNYLIVDPCSGRAFFMLWIRVTADGKWFVYREWPGSYYIPGIGVPEAWAEPSAGREMDGKMGRGQKSPGWGLDGYKREIARLEGWHVLTPGTGTTGKGKAYLWEMRCPDGMRECDFVKGWDENGPTDERVFERFMDARFANTKSFEAGGMVTLIDKFDEEMGLTFFDSSSGGGQWTIDDGCALVMDALAWDRNRELSFFNEPRLFVSDACTNLIFALKTWTGADGQKGATKDPIDCLRMAFLKGCRYVDPMNVGGVVGGGGCY